MKNMLIVIIAFLAVSFVPKAYGFQTQIEAEWIHPNFINRVFSKITVVAVNDDLEAVKLFENLAVKHFRKKGINAVTGSSVFASLNRDEVNAPDELIRIIRENRVEGIITMSLIKTVESVRYVPGRIYSVGVGRKAFGIYWITHYKTMREPGKFERTEAYLLEASLFDLKDGIFEGKETLVWQGQTSLVNPKSREKAAKKFTKPMMKHLVKKGIVKPKPKPESKSSKLDNSNK